MSAMDDTAMYMLLVFVQNVVLWGMLVLPLVELAVVCVMTLVKLPPQRRRGLFVLFFVMLGLAAVLFGGAWVLDRNGLAWRTWPQNGLSLVLWLLGLTTGIMAVAYAGRWLSERRKGVVVGLSSFCLASAMFVGTILGGLWCAGPGEQVVTYQGERMILGKWVWMDTSYELYEYHGPLVRGAGPAVVDFQLDDVEDAVIDW